MFLIAFISLLGIGVAFASGPCMSVYARNREDAWAFGVAPWSLVGMIGYAAIAVAAVSGYRSVTFALALGAAVVTAWLIKKARAMPDVCPLCMTSWIVTLVLLLLSAYQALPR